MNTIRQTLTLSRTMWKALLREDMVDAVDECIAELDGQKPKQPADLRDIAQCLFDVVRDHSAGPKFNADHEAAYQRAIAAGFKPSYP